MICQSLAMARDQAKNNADHSGKSWCVFIDTSGNFRAELYEGRDTGGFSSLSGVEVYTPKSSLWGTTPPVSLMSVQEKLEAMRTLALQLAELWKGAEEGVILEVQHGDQMDRSMTETQKAFEDYVKRINELGGQ